MVKIGGEMIALKGSSVHEELERETAIHLVTLSRLVPHKQIEHAMDTVARMPGAVLDEVAPPQILLAGVKDVFRRGGIS